MTVFVIYISFIVVIKFKISKKKSVVLYYSILKAILKAILKGIFKSYFQISKVISRFLTAFSKLKKLNVKIAILFLVFTSHIIKR